MAHELGPLAPLVDRAVVMRDGRIVYDGAAADAEDGACTATTTRRTTTTTTSPWSLAPFERRRP